MEAYQQQYHIMIHCSINYTLILAYLALLSSAICIYAQIRKLVQSQLANYQQT